MFSFVETCILRSRYYVLLLLLVVFAAVKAGAWYIPNSQALSLLARDPFINPYDGSTQYLFSNWLIGFLAWLLHARSAAKYVFLNSAFSIAFLAITFVSMRYKLSEGEWRKAVCLFVCLPVSWTHLYWIGYDSLTLTLMALIIACLNLPLVTFFLGVGLGLQHQSHGFFAMTFLALAALVTRQERRDGAQSIWGSVSSLCGVLVGILILKLIMWTYDIHVTFDRSDWLSHNLAEMVTNNITSWQVYLYCLLGPGWLIVLRRHDSIAITGALVVTICTSAALSFVTDDVTRVFAVLSYPAVAFCLLYNKAWLATISTREVAIVVSVWLIAPWLFLWAGKPRTSVFTYDVAAVSHALVGWPHHVFPTTFRR